MMRRQGPPLPPSRVQLGAVRRSSSMLAWVEARSAAHPRGARVACAGGCPAPYSRPVGGREAWRARIGARSSPCRRPGACLRSNTVSASSGCPRMFHSPGCGHAGSGPDRCSRGPLGGPPGPYGPREETLSPRDARGAWMWLARRGQRWLLPVSDLPAAKKFRPLESWRVPSTKPLIDAASPCERSRHRWTPRPWAPWARRRR